jgi:hypothetical protein
LTTGPLPPPVASRDILFLVSPAAGPAQNAGLPGHLSEPREPAWKPNLGPFLSLSSPFLRRNRTTPVLVRMSEAQRINGLRERRRGAGSKGARSGGVTWDQTVYQRMCVRLPVHPGDPRRAARRPVQTPAVCHPPSAVKRRASLARSPEGYPGSNVLLCVSASIVGARRRGRPAAQLKRRYRALPIFTRLNSAWRAIARNKVTVGSPAQLIPPRIRLLEAIEPCLASVSRNLKTSGEGREKMQVLDRGRMGTADDHPATQAAMSA